MLFKYLPIERLDVVEKMRIRFSPLKSLNDPFESRPLIKPTEELLQHNTETFSQFDDLFNNLPSEEKTSENKALIEKEKERYKDNISPAKLGDGFMSVLDSTTNLGILSLCRNNSSLLMWSHYASENKGYVIGFNKEHSFLNQQAPNGETVKPTPIIYSTKRPQNDMHDQNLFHNKPLEWAYEEEERLTINHYNRHGSREKDPFGMDVILTEIPKGAISSIYLGCNSSDDTKQKIKSYLKNHNVCVPVYKAFMSETEYKLEFELV